MVLPAYPDDGSQVARPFGKAQYGLRSMFEIWISELLSQYTC